MPALVLPSRPLGPQYVRFPLCLPVVGCASVGGGVAVLAGVVAGGTFEPGVAWGVVGALAVPAGAGVPDTESSIREVPSLSSAVGCSGVVGVSPSCRCGCRWDL